MRRSLLRFVALMLAALHVAACSSWQLAQLTPRQVLDSRSEERVRVVRTDGSVLVMEEPLLMSDTVVAGVRSPGQWREMRVPLEEVRTIEVRRISRARTFLLANLLVVGLPLLALSWIAAID